MFTDKINKAFHRLLRETHQNLRRAEDNMNEVQEILGQLTVIDKQMKKLDDYIGNKKGVIEYENQRNISRYSPQYLRLNRELPYFNMKYKKLAVNQRRLSERYHELMCIVYLNNAKFQRR
jgi:hypothetical protein